MNPFQSDNIWKKKARQGKAQQHPLTPQQEWQKQVNSSSLWLGGGVVLLALYLAAVRAGTVALDASAVVLIVVVGCFCVYTAASLGRLMKNKPEEKAAKKKKNSRFIFHTAFHPLLLEQTDFLVGQATATYGIWVVTWFIWSHCAPAEDIMVVSEIGEQ